MNSPIDDAWRRVIHQGQEDIRIPGAGPPFKIGVGAQERIQDLFVAQPESRGPNLSSEVGYYVSRV